MRHKISVVLLANLICGQLAWANGPDATPASLSNPSEGHAKEKSARHHKTSRVNGSAALALAQSNGCMSCHSVETKVVGPAYKDVAAKYKGDKAAEQRLIEKVKLGGSGVWGAVPMPPNSQVADKDIKTIVKWILSL